MSYWDDRQARAYNHDNHTKYDAAHGDTRQWSREGYRPAYPAYGVHPDFHEAPEASAPASDTAQSAGSQQRKRSRVGVLVIGTAAVAMAAGAATAVAVVDHPAQHAPQAQAPVPSGIGRPAPAPDAARPGTAAPEGSVEQVSAKVLPSVVKLQVETGQGRAEGSGIVLSEDGLILTNNHVVAEASQAADDTASEGGFPGLPRGMFPGPGQFTPGAQGSDDGASGSPFGQNGGRARATLTFSDGRTVPFSVVGTDPDDDIAVVKAQNVSGLTPITIGSSADLKVGQKVVAIGSPLGLQGTVTTGIISALNRPVATGDDRSGQHSMMSAIQTDAAINPGNSGGALVDMNGDLIGVNSAIASLGGGQAAQSGSIGLGFAIPVDQAKRIADELVSTGSVQHASLGVQLATDDAGHGAAVAGVVDGGAAAAAGLPEGAVITKLDDQVIDGPEALIAAVRARTPGDTVTLAYEDASGASSSVQVTLGSVQA